jgi:hypothetical protein
MIEADVDLVYAVLQLLNVLYDKEQGNVPSLPQGNSNVSFQVNSPEEVADEADDKTANSSTAASSPEKRKSTESQKSAATEADDANETACAAEAIAAIMSNKEVEFKERWSKLVLALLKATPFDAEMQEHGIELLGHMARYTLRTDYEDWYHYLF